MRIEDLRPVDTPEYMTPAWLGCIHWAIGTPEIVDAFRRESGMAWTPARNGLDRMIDEATGVEKRFIEAFIEWANANIWGPMR
jgi:hypothetical protein